MVFASIHRLIRCSFAKSCMIQTREIRALGDYIAGHRIEWGGLVERFRAHPRYDADQALHLDQYMRAFSALHVQTALDAAVHHAGDRLHLDTNIGPERGKRTESRDVTLYRDPKGSVYASMDREDSGHLVTLLYDGLIRVDDVPTVINLRWKMLPWRGLGSVKRGKLQDKLEQRVVGSLQTELGVDCGYILMVSPGLKNSFGSGKSGGKGRSSVFKRLGGVIVSAPMGRYNFRERVKREVIRTGLQMWE